MKLKFDINEFYEMMVVGVVMLGILLPARLFFINIIGNSWLGSFGVVTAVAVTFLYLAKKNKLGKFGQIFIRQMFKVHRGRRRYLVYPNLAFAVFFTTAVIIGIEQGNTIYETQKIDLKADIPFESQQMEEIIKQTPKITPIDFVKALLAVFYFLIFRFDVFAVLVATLNDFSNNFVSHFSTIFLVEQLELIGILIYYRLTITKKTVNF